MTNIIADGWTAADVNKWKAEFANYAAAVKKPAPKPSVKSERNES